MKRYRFLLLAFFLANNVHAEGLISGINLSVSPVLANINSTPDLRSTGNSSVPDVRGQNNSVSPTTNNTIPEPTTPPTGVDSIPDTGNRSGSRARNSGAATATDIRRTSPRNTTEVGNSVEPYVSGSRTSDSELNNRGNGARSAVTTKNVKTSAKGMSCKTYEGKTYDEGEAGYADCMRNIRTDRQGTRTVP